MRLGGQALLSAGIVAALLGAAVVVTAGDASDAVVELRSAAKPEPGAVATDKDTGLPVRDDSGLPEVADVDDALVSDVANRIQTVAEYEENGYAGVRLDAAGRHVDLWWKGPVDADVEAVLADVRREGLVTVDVLPAENSRAEMRRLSERLGTSSRMAALGMKVTALSAPPDQSGFRVVIERAPRSSAAERAARLDRARAEAEEITGVRILSVVEGGGEEHVGVR